MADARQRSRTDIQSYIVELEPKLSKITAVNEKFKKMKNEITGKRWEAALNLFSAIKSTLVASGSRWKSVQTTMQQLETKLQEKAQVLPPNGLMPELAGQEAKLHAKPQQAPSSGGRKQSSEQAKLEMNYAKLEEVCRTQDHAIKGLQEDTDRLVAQVKRMEIDKHSLEEELQKMQSAKKIVEDQLKAKTETKFIDAKAKKLQESAKEAKEALNERDYLVQLVRGMRSKLDDRSFDKPIMTKSPEKHGISDSSRLSTMTDISQKVEDIRLFVYRSEKQAKEADICMKYFSDNLQSLRSSSRDENFKENADLATPARLEMKDDLYVSQAKRCREEFEEVKKSISGIRRHLQETTNERDYLEKLIKSFIASVGNEQFRPLKELNKPAKCGVVGENIKIYEDFHEQLKDVLSRMREKNKQWYEELLELKTMVRDLHRDVCPPKTARERRRNNQVTSTVQEEDMLEIIAQIKKQHMEAAAPKVLPEQATEENIDGNDFVKLADAVQRLHKHIIGDTDETTDSSEDTAVQILCKQVKQIKTYFESVKQSLRNVEAKTFCTAMQELHSNLKQSTDTYSPAFGLNQDVSNDHKLFIQCGNKILHMNNELKQKRDLLAQQTKIKDEELKSLKKECADQEAQIVRLHDEAKDERKRKSHDVSGQKIKELTKQIHDKDTKIYSLVQENEHLWTRLSAVAGDKLTHGNQNIADLSDPNRPTKIAEKFSELYDNEWTDAFEELAKYKKSEPSAIIALRDLLQNGYQFCLEQSEIYFLKLAHDLVLKVDGQPKRDRTDKSKVLSEARMKPVRDLVRSFGPDNVLAVQQLFRSQRKKDKNDKILSLCGKYADDCIELCWFMAIQDPPLFMDFSAKQGDILDSTKFREYSRSGKVVEFLVWPALQLSEKGSLLTKGVVQVTSP